MNLDAFMGHDLWALTDAAIESINVADAKPDRVETLSRARIVLSMLRGFKTPAHAAILSPAVLDGARTQLDYVTAHLGGQPSNIEAYLDQLLSYIAPWTLLLPPAKQAEQARAATVAMTEAMVKQLSAFKEREAKLRSDSDELLSRLKAADERLAILENAIGQTAAVHQETFTKAEADRTAASVIAAEKAKDEVERAIEGYVRSSQLEFENIENTLTAAKKHLKDIENVVGRAASLHIAGDHGAYAKREFRAAWWAYGVGAAALISGAVVILLGMEELRTDSDPNWAWLAAKLSYGALVGAVATVAFRLGGRFISSSHQAKRLELELLSLEPFLANVDKDKAQTAKLAFMERTFGREPDQAPPTDAEDPSIPLSTYQGVAEAIVAVAKKTP